jgi:hypothetical protein
MSMKIQYQPALRLYLAGAQSATCIQNAFHESSPPGNIKMAGTCLEKFVGIQGTVTIKIFT